MRSACGLLNGSVGVSKSMLGEITDSSNRGLAFAIWESSFGIGQIGKCFIKKFYKIFRKILG
jgi:hypothetical protein